MPRLCCLLLSLLIASSASAVAIDWTPIRSPGNACDPQALSGGGTDCFGSVDHEYYIGTYEVTNAQYAEFLNAKAKSDPLGLYNPAMSIPMGNGWAGGITQSGSPGTYTYSTIPGRENRPVNWVTFYDAMRFANWMNNGQGNADTEAGAYTLLGGTATPSNGETVTRNSGAAIFVTSENEWYKAAYYDASSSTYFDYPTGSNTIPTCSPPTSTPNRANCNFAFGAQDLANVGSYPGSTSPNGTYDQGGNAQEWTEAVFYVDDYPYQHRIARGGEYVSGASWMSASTRFYLNSGDASNAYGFRLAMIPEPSTGLLVISGLVGFAGRCRARLKRDSARPHNGASSPSSSSASSPGTGYPRRRCASQAIRFAMSPPIDSTNMSSSHARACGSEIRQRFFLSPGDGAASACRKWMS
jgi:formylglycine-generating enzyme